MVRSLAAFPPTVALAVLLALSTLGAVVFSGGPVRAQTQDFSSLNDRLERLQRDIDVLQRQMARQGSSRGSSSGAPAAGGGDVSTSFIDRTESRFEGLEQQLRDLTGRVEQLSFQINQLTSRMDKLVSDVDFRLNAIEKGGGAAAPAPVPSGGPAPSTQGSTGQPQVAPGQPRLSLVPGAPGQAPPAAATPATAAAPELPQGSPEAQYEFAYGVLLQAQREQSDFGRAEQALRAFINANPTHRLAGNAQYWLGETYYVRKDYPDAAATFAEGLQKYPKSDKAPDNLLKLGMSLAQLNRKPDACGALAELNKRFPNAAPQIKTTAQRERTRLGCT